MGVVTRAARVLEVLAVPGAVHAARRTRPFSLSAFLIARDLRAGCGEIGTLVDVGANAGQFSAAMAAAYPRARIVAVEPLPDVAATLRATLASTPHARVLEYAAGASAGTATIHRHAYTLSSSLLATTDAFAASFPGAAGAGAVTEVEVAVARLDDLLDVAALPGPVLLKLDVQGFEIEALRGAPELLARCDHVLAEASLERVYDGEPLFTELQDHLRGHGFTFDRPVDFLRGARGPVSQMDVLFRRTTHHRTTDHRTEDRPAASAATATTEGGHP